MLPLLRTCMFHVRAVCEQTLRAKGTLINESSNPLQHAIFPRDTGRIGHFEAHPLKMPILSVVWEEKCMIGAH